VSTKYETLVYDVAEHVATLTLNRPDVHNAMNDAMRRELTRCFEALAVDDDVKVVVVTGAGEKAFSAGAKDLGNAPIDFTLVSDANHGAYDARYTPNGINTSAYSDGPRSRRNAPSHGRGTRYCLRATMSNTSVISPMVWTRLPRWSYVTGYGPTARKRLPRWS